jgi:hypothetical protein
VQLLRAFGLDHLTLHEVLLGYISNVRITINSVVLVYEALCHLMVSVFLQYDKRLFQSSGDLDNGINYRWLKLKLLETVP